MLAHADQAFLLGLQVSGWLASGCDLQIAYGPIRFIV